MNIYVCLSVPDSKKSEVTHRNVEYSKAYNGEICMSGPSSFVAFLRIREYDIVQTNKQNV